VAGADVIEQHLAQMRRCLAGVGGRRRLLEELAGHLDDAVRSHEAAGLTPREAAERAVRECGAATEVLQAVEINDERRERIMAVTRWTGLAGVVAVPSALLGMLLWSWVSFAATLLLVAAAMIGLLALHWRVARAHIAVGLALFAVGNAVAATNPVGSAHPVYTAGIPAVCILIAATLAGIAFLRGDAVPAPAVWLMLAGVWILLGINTALWIGGSEPPYLAVVGAAAATTGWLWSNANLALRGARPQAAAA
jgi:hypothetical protein